LLPPPVTLPGRTPPTLASDRRCWRRRWGGGQDPELQAALNQAAQEADRELLRPLFQFRNLGVPSAHHWNTQTNGASFGTDYLTRAAIAKSNIFVNRPAETTYFYQDLDATGARLNGTSGGTPSPSRAGSCHRSTGSGR
jgi:hypothetical protein